MGKVDQTSEHPPIQAKLIQQGFPTGFRKKIWIKNKKTKKTNCVRKSKRMR